MSHIALLHQHHFFLSYPLGQQSVPVSSMLNQTPWHEKWWLNSFDIQIRSTDPRLFLVATTKHRTSSAEFLSKSIHVKTKTNKRKKSSFDFTVLHPFGLFQQFSTASIFTSDKQYPTPRPNNLHHIMYLSTDVLYC